MLGCIHIRKKTYNIYEELKHLRIVLKIPYKNFPPIKINFFIRMPPKLGSSAAYDTCIKKTHITRLLMLLLSSKNSFHVYN